MNSRHFFPVCSLLLVQFLYTAFGVADTDASLCRLEPHWDLSADDFQKMSCFICYVNIMDQDSYLGNIKFTYNMNVFPFVLMDDKNISHVADPDDVNSLVYKSFEYNYTRNQWRQCCHQAVECCNKMQNDTAILDLEGRGNSSCLPAWSFHQCRPLLQTGESYESDCPDYGFAYMPKPPCKRKFKRTCRGNITESIAHCKSLEFHRRPEDGQSPEEVANQVSGEDHCCRTEREYELSTKAYAMDTCAKCYSYFPRFSTNDRFSYDMKYGMLKDIHNKGVLVVAEPTNEEILSSFISDDLKDKWKNCCFKALKCCQTMTEADNYTQARSFCPRTWDGWQCFGDTAVGEKAYVDCPIHAYYLHNAAPQCTRQAEKRCIAHNTWFRKTRDGGVLKEYTNYSPCSKKGELTNHEYFHLACNILSLAALIPALIIFSSYRQLRVARIQMHRNFFLALVLSCILTITYRIVIIFPEMQVDSDLETPIETNGIGCKILLLFCRYTRLCTYTWMLCEGFYLQRLITCAFVEQKRLTGYYIVGWVFPLLPITIYAIVMKTQADVRCWTNATPYEWIFGFVFLSSILMNLIFLFNIVRVLITKLRSVQSTEPSHYRKAVRATLMLIPLFGTHFFLATYNGHSAFTTCAAVTFYAYFKGSIDGLQGFCVSLIYCYFNGEVLYLLRRTYQQIQVYRGIQPNVSRTRWSVSTQVTNAVDPQSRGVSPPCKGKIIRKNSLTKLMHSMKSKPKNTYVPEKTTDKEPSPKPAFDDKSVAKNDILPNKTKVTEL